MANVPFRNILIYNSVEKVHTYWDAFKPRRQIDFDYQNKWLNQASFFDQVSLQSRVCITLWDSSTNQFIYSVDKTKVLGEHAVNFTKRDGIDYTMSNFHPEHLQSCLLAQQIAIGYCIEHPEFLPFKIIINHDCLYDKCGTYIHFLQQISIVETDDKGHPLLFLSFIYDITHLKKAMSSTLIVTSPTETLMWNYEVGKNNFYSIRSLTGKEKEILQFLGEGKHTKEIAAILHLSPHTVDTHRSNLLTKTNCVDTTALVTYCRMVGLL